MDVQNSIDGTPQMLPPPPGTFIDREELIKYVGEFAVSQGYVVTIKQSKRDKVVVLGCDRGGVYRNRRKVTDESSGVENTRQRKTGSRLTNCPFEAVGKKEEGLWVLHIRTGTHNHEPLRNISEHPSARRLSENEIFLIKEMTEAGLKPRQILKRLRQTNPELRSTPKHVYNVKAKLRQGNTTVRNFKSLAPQTTAVENNFQAAVEQTRQRNSSRVPNLIGGRFVDSQSFASIDVVNPATEEVVSRVPLSIDEEFKAAAFAAKRALPSWRSTPITTRQRIIFKLQDLIRRDIDKLAMTITAEHGKVLKDAYDEVLRGLEVVENACGLAIVQMGQFTPNISKGIDSYSIREPLGVCAGICPFEFPAMIPLWMFPAAIACGNTFILKPSEQVPGASMMLAELAMEAGLPSGVLNIVHGNNDILNAICDHEDIKAISFVGPTPAGAFVHSRASAHRKRVQSNTGIKNLAVVMPDANMGATLNALVAAGFGGGGQKCAAISTVVFIGSLSPWEDKLLERARQIKVNAGTEEEAELGPVSSKQAKERICQLIQKSIESGARLVLDGRLVAVAGYNQGNFMGPTILSDVTVNMDCYKEEISGPVLLCMQILLTTLHAQADSVDEAINIINGNKYVSGASIFTISGLIARKFQSEVEVGQVGINAPISDPLPFTSSFGSRPTFTGDVNIDGKAGLIHFYTQMKRVTQQWIGIENTTADGGNSGP
ncbi:methylmalonate-semialdehyde dehydrogenase [acylating], mitochondrial-like isoform X2 [Punica granatum]|uniref:methylmalonate-semialdehyde dehydrogenase (CoA acylating) n=1 Tax=Punica granatum TaxID=22663 RepID=A0A6P8CU35_PUNGR|nr:methylmalonate-semialdehyde dehydrogenase [acylating], mitochondrial-like isoform X2 [Punica granatum]